LISVADHRDTGFAARLTGVCNNITGRNEQPSHE
jgi:hypothetical protein